MKPLSFKIISDKTLLCVFLFLLWGVADSNAQSTSGTSLTTAVTTAPSTTILTTIQPLENVRRVNVTQQTESSITLEWEKVKDIPSYFLKYQHNGDKEVLINGTGAEPTISHNVTNLAAGTKYNFTVITTLNEANSTGTIKETFTWPRNAKDFEYIDQTETSITLQWTKVENNHYEVEYNSQNKSFTVSEEKVIRTISGLTNTTEYIFTLFTVFENVRSTGVNTTAFTAPPNPEGLETLGQNKTSITLQWKKVGNLNFKLEFNKTLEEIPAIEGEATVTKTIHGLKRGTKYSFSLFAVFHNISSSGLNFSAVTAPGDAEKFNVIAQNETSITLQWEKVDDLPEYSVTFNGSEKNVTSPEGDSVVTFTASGLQSGTKYDFDVFTVFENVKSSGVTITAVTAPRNTDKISTVEQNESSITLQWEKVNDIFNYTLEYGENEINISASEGNNVTVTHLSNMTKYNFTLFTVFEDVKSSGVHIAAATAPPNPEHFRSAGQNENSITLWWEKVGDILDYRLVFGGNVINITAPKEHQQVTWPVLGLENGTEYTFRIFALFEDIRSSGRELIAATVPLRVASVNFTQRSVSSVTLEWTSSGKGWSYLLHIDGRSYKLTEFREIVSKFITALAPGVVYPFNVTTQFSGLSSGAYEDFTVTTIYCERQKWSVTHSTITGIIDGAFTNATASNKSEIHTSTGSRNVSITGLYPGATYEIDLVFEKDSRYFRQCNHKFTITTLPPVVEAYCEYSGSGYSALIAWNEPPGIWDAVTVAMHGNIRTLATDRGRTITISGLQPANSYEVSVATLSRDRRSPLFVFSCVTDPRGVIAGSVIGVLLFVALVAFILFKRPDLIRRNNPFISGTKQNNKKSKAISVEKFSDHFYQLSADANRGFSQEYESLAPVGTEQTRKDACLPENKPRNRFNNVLPYDWCRVKLTSSDADGMSDYINANYMPGYNSSREYIATQGPLPSTIDDFWRMIWEQRVKGIVMVTNCKESEKTKCERYWPGDQKPFLFEKLSVTMTNEQQEPYWTLREFTLRHKNHSAERKVKHFHFTAWPDHGVPQGTEVLIQFRGLVRQHIEREGSGAPTVVHCSAGVGRTGTIIALDVLLQQLEKERAVGINSFVHKMRLSRPYMVQTESQYVFLHQCIMDILHHNEKIEENIYENEDMMYVNATALREFHKGSQA